MNTYETTRPEVLFCGLCFNKSTCACTTVQPQITSEWKIFRTPSKNTYFIIQIAALTLLPVCVVALFLLIAKFCPFVHVHTCFVPSRLELMKLHSMIEHVVHQQNTSILNKAWYLNNFANEKLSIEDWVSFILVCCIHEQAHFVYTERN